MENKNWIAWLQARIPHLKESHNEFWISQALDGYLLDAQKKALNMSGVVVSPCTHPYSKVINQKYSFCHNCEKYFED
jgi:hypothetical protein